MINLELEMVNIAYTKEKFLDLMDEIDAFGIKVLGVDKRYTPENWVIIAFSDGAMMFHREQWEVVLEMWELESIENLIMLETDLK